MPSPDGQATCTITGQTAVISPEEVTPDANDDVVFTLDASRAGAWRFADEPITIVEDEDFTVTRLSDTQIRVHDNENDSRGKPSAKTHKYTLHFVTFDGRTHMDVDPTIKDRV